MWITAVIKCSYTNIKMPYAPAEAGSSQSARCPPDHSPQTRPVSVTSQQPLKKLTRRVDIFILKHNMHNFKKKKKEEKKRNITTLDEHPEHLGHKQHSISTYCDNRKTLRWHVKHQKSVNENLSIPLNSRLVLSSLKEVDRSLLTVSCTAEIHSTVTVLGFPGLNV